MAVEGLEVACGCHWLHQVVANAGIFLSSPPHPFMQIQWHHRLMQAWPLRSDSASQFTLACHGHLSTNQVLRDSHCQNERCLLLRPSFLSCGEIALPFGLAVFLVQILSAQASVVIVMLEVFASSLFVLEAGVWK